MFDLCNSVLGKEGNTVVCILVSRLLLLEQRIAMLLWVHVSPVEESYKFFCSSSWWEYFRYSMYK